MLPLPAISDVIASTTAVTVVMFPQYAPVIWIVLGVFIATLVVGFVVAVFGRGAKHVLRRRGR